MQVLITGSHGMVGRALAAALAAEDVEVRRLVRHGPAGDGVWLWDPRGGLDPEALEGVDAVVHLAGASLATRWTPRRKALIRDSRVAGTAVLSEHLAAMGHPPGVLVCASGVGIYGDGGDVPLPEATPPGRGFLPDLCRAWEAAADPAREAGIRVVALRFGMVLSPTGGALARMLPPFRLGLGGRLGGGRQYVPWIALPDAVGAIRFAITTNALVGPVNACAPEAVTNAEFTRALGRAVGRPTPFPVPAPVLRLAFGPMANEMLLASTRAVPAALTEARFPFRHPTLAGALAAVLA
jgi:uncharacterized protein (TIGR01777 family)